jgi:hypothetical protein
MTELAGRSLAFLHNVLNELTILDVAFSEEGSVSAWVFVSTLEILATICGQQQQQRAIPDESGVTSDPLGNEVDVVDVGKGKHHHHGKGGVLGVQDFSVHTASLWDYAREKVSKQRRRDSVR